jgi:hypothetical protein
MPEAERSNRGPLSFYLLESIVGFPWDGAAGGRAGFFLAQGTDYSSPLVQHVNPIGNWNSRGFEIAEGG